MSHGAPLPRRLLAARLSIPPTRLWLWLQLVLPLVVTGLGLVIVYALAAPFVRKLPIPVFVVTVSVALLIEIVVPLAVVVALGASFREIGFGPGYRSWRTWWSALSSRPAFDRPAHASVIGLRPHTV